MKLSLSAAPQRGSSSRRTEWSWCGFGAGLLGYVVLSAVFGAVPEDAWPKAMWLVVGLVPASMGLFAGFTLASLLD
ncbi:hypothetical protein BURC_02383 [Burkholderiaceae bacterium]|nr:hypothetical protein BURC_02383 [Burkholderiaceae bacterium]